MTRILVTGAAGHIGGNLVRALLAQGHPVRALVHRDRRALEGLDVEVAEGDLLDPDSLRVALDGIETLYHLAGVISIDGDRTGRVRRTNVLGVREVMSRAREAGVKRVVHFSSIHAFDSTSSGPALDERTERVRDGVHPAYDLSKRDGEVEVRRAVAAGLDAVIVNPTGVIGPLDFKPSRMGQVFIDLHQRKMPALVGGGFDFVDVRDVVAGAIAAAESGRTGENYLLSGQRSTVREIAEAAETVTGVPAPRMETPMALARAVAPLAVWFSRLTGSEPLFTPESLAALRTRREVSHEKASRELGYSPRPLQESVRDIYACFRHRGVLEPPNTRRST